MKHRVISKILCLLTAVSIGSGVALGYEDDYGYDPGYDSGSNYNSNSGNQYNSNQYNPYVNRQYYGGMLCAYPQFTCVDIKPGDTWTSLFPNPRERDMVKRLNRTNISLRNRGWIVVPTNLKQITLLDLSPFPAKVESSGKKLVVVSLKRQAFGAYDEGGNLIHWGPVSGGKEWCEDIGRPCRTAVGSFTFISKKGPSCKSSTFPVETDGGAPMPYCMHYYRGFALHAAKLPGYHASHGCVRLFNRDAKWLNLQFVDIGTKVIVMRD